MGSAARRNPRARAHGGPPAFQSLHRLWRAVAFFGMDRVGFEAWMNQYQLTEPQRAALEHLWQQQRASRHGD